MYPHLGKPGRIAGLVTRNRIIKSPQATSTANPDGTVTERTVNHYRRLGEGGVGLVMVEYSYVDEDASKSIHNQIGLSNREHIAGLGWLVDEVHSTGAKVGVQLVHCGRQRFLATNPIKSSSAVSWDYVEAQKGNVPVPMSLDEIQGVAVSFGEAANRAHRARFDIVEIHAGHGYLITNFLSPHINKRTDRYGGSFDNRSRLLLEIVDAIRADVPPGFPISVRLSVTDYEEDGIRIEETAELCRRLEAHGVDVIHASGGHHALMEYEVSPWYMPRALHRWGWEKIREAVSIPIIGSGSLVSPEVAEDVLASGSADFVSLGRAMLADPDWANKSLAGRPLAIVPCIRCNDGCLHRGLNVGRSVGCSVNPEVAEEGRFPVRPAAVTRSVAVVGGGPAGLKSAAVLADRGHSVTLFEPSALGGLLNHAAASTLKQDIGALIPHLTHEVDRRGIEVTREYASVDRLAGGFDAVIIATGAPQRAPDFDIESSRPALNAADATADKNLTGHIVVIGGGLQGCETALRLAQNIGAKVTIVESRPALLGGDEVFTDLAGLPGRIEISGISVRTDTRAVRVDDSGVHVETGEGSGELIGCDAVVLALGREPADNTLYRELLDRGVETHLVGSAVGPGRVYDAIHSAYFTARTV